MGWRGSTATAMMGTAAAGNYDKIQRFEEIFKYRVAGSLHLLRLLPPANSKVGQCAGLELWWMNDRLEVLED
jgi:hypothetical protein